MPGGATSPIDTTVRRLGTRAARSSPGAAFASSGAIVCSISTYADDLKRSAAITAVQPTLFNAYSSSASRYAGLMFTRIAPMRAVANCVSSHSLRFGDQMPTRSPLRMPSAARPAASTSISVANSRQVQRTCCSRNTTAGRSGKRSAVSRRKRPIVASDSGTSVAPRTYDSPFSGAISARTPRSAAMSVSVRFCLCGAGRPAARGRTAASRNADDAAFR